MAMRLRTILSKLPLQQVHPWSTEFSLTLKRYSQSTTADFITQQTEHTHKMSENRHRKPEVVEKVESIEEGRKSIKVFPPPSKIASQSVIISEFDRARASICVDNPERFVSFPDEETLTVRDTITSGKRKSSSDRCLGFRSQETGKYEWITYSEVIERRTHIGSGLINLGISPSQKSMVGLCTKTRPEFVLTLYACAEYSMVLVPLYYNFGEDVLCHIINQVEMEVLICEDIDVVKDVIKSSEKFPKLKTIVLIDPPEANVDVFKDSRFKALTLKDLEAIGKSNIHKPNIPDPDDLLCLIYTSGTTGPPKGVMIKHRNVLASFAATNIVFGDSIPLTRRIFCYLPCAHIYEIVNEIFAIYQGGELGFYGGNTDALLSDIVELKPTILPLVPKIMNLIYSGVKKKIGSNILRRGLVRYSINQNEKQLKKGIITKTGLHNKFILSKIQNVLGGGVELMITSSAPVSKEVMRFFRCAMGCLVFEIYGLSEVGAATVTLIAEHDTGAVGPPLPCNHIKLTDVPELSYFSKDDVGEICIRGSNVFQGYYKNEEATNEAIDKDGWYHTGDIGKWLSNGTLSVIDRKKHIFKMSQGEYIVPDKIEGIYIQSHIIHQVFVDGDSDQEFTVGIVVPDEKPFIDWAKDEGFENQSFEDLCKNQDVKKALLSHMLKTGKKKGLNSLHQVGNISLCCEPFSQENNLLTPTMKVKRTEARKAFKNTFKKLYEEGNLRKSQDP